MTILINDMITATFREMADRGDWPFFTGGIEIKFVWDARDVEETNTIEDLLNLFRSECLIIGNSPAIRTGALRLAIDLPVELEAVDLLRNSGYEIVQLRAL